MGSHDITTATARRWSGERGLQRRSGIQPEVQGRVAILSPSRTWQRSYGTVLAFQISEAVPELTFAWSSELGKTCCIETQCHHIESTSTPPPNHSNHPPLPARDWHIGEHWRSSQTGNTTFHDHDHLSSRGAGGRFQDSRASSAGLPGPRKTRLSGLSSRPDSYSLASLPASLHIRLNRFLSRELIGPLSLAASRPVAAVLVETPPRSTSKSLAASTTRQPPSSEPGPTLPSLEAQQQQCIRF